MKQDASVDMKPELFPDLPDHTRLWIYQSSHELSDSDCKVMEEKLLDFCNNWSSHGKPLKCDAAILYNTFIVIGVDEISQSASGCSIDNSVNFIKELEEDHDVNFFENLIIAVLIKEKVKLYDMDTFKEKYKDGEIDEETLIFNNQVKTKSEYERSWLIPLKKSWQFNLIRED